jgi:hypothetical protein
VDDTVDSPQAAADRVTVSDVAADQLDLGVQISRLSIVDLGLE